MIFFQKLKHSLILLAVLVAASSFALAHPAENLRVSEESKFSILTCTPGPDLYSLFGHSAIRFQDIQNGQIIDWVYNYGTFQFDENFYWKFAMGKLDYLLSKEDFPYFQQGYIIEGRGIYEQDLLLSQPEKQKLLELLEENYLPQNRTYRYDFFYDNCSTRIRDIISQALPNQLTFQYHYEQPRSFRQAIQSYLDYQPWSDLGIDIALGIPCDRIVQPQQMMFLPDSLMHEMTWAQKDNQPLIIHTQEILPRDYELQMNTTFTPVVVFFLFLILHIAVGFLFLHRKIAVQPTDRILLAVSGLIGLLVVFLWFFTDHTATAWNLNILWANPLNLILAFSNSKALSGWRKTYLLIYILILTLTLVAWFILPQRLHFSLISLILGLIFTCFKWLRPQFFLNKKTTQIKA